jgi:peptide/nickel transport system substrate-binding protein
MLSRHKYLSLLSLLVVLSVLVNACGAAVAPAGGTQPAATTEQAASGTSSETAAGTTGPVLTDKPADVEEKVANAKVFNSPEDAGGIAEYHEAPELTEMVTAGTLPPVAERLPTNPVVVQPEETIGKYGGTLNTTIFGDYSQSVEVTYWEYELLITLSPQGEIIPNVAESWEWNDDYTQLTLHIRDGIKWSDGVPYTADDIMFWWDDIMLNTELTPTPHSLLFRDGKLAELEKVDDLSVKFTFAAPYAIFTTYLGSWGFPGLGPTNSAKHYLSQFHPTYTPVDEIETKMKADGFDTWVDFFKNNSDRTYDGGNPDLPTLSAWIINEVPPQPVQTYRRNPYYFKVDTEGNQLPYIGEIRSTRTTDAEATLLKTIAGELDWVGIGWVGGPANLAILTDNREKGDYRFTSGNWMPNAYGNIMFNYTTKDETKRELYNNVDFRRALSVAINREEIVKLVYKGGVFPSQIAPARGEPYHGESELFQTFAQYDPDLANQMLDDIGLTERDADGFRKAPNGEDLLLIISANTSWPAETPQLMDLVRGYWAEVGINATVTPEEGTLWTTRHNNGEHDLSARGGHFGGGPVHPTLNSNTFALGGWQWGPDWAKWLDTDGAEGVEPPDAVKQIREIRDQVMGEPDEAKRVELIMQVFQIQMDNLWSIGLVVDNPRFGQLQIVKNRVRNVPTFAFSAEWYSQVPASFFINE